MALLIAGQHIFKLPVKNGFAWNHVARLHKRKKLRPALSSHTDWKYPEPGTHSDLYRVRKWEDLSFGWAKPLLEYRERKRLEAQENEGKPPKEPHMIHVVTRIKSCYGRPWWEKRIIVEFGLESMNKPVPLKNTPDVNTKLKEVKHLLDIKPLTFPHGIPEDESDYKYCQLRTNGQLIVKKSIPELIPRQLGAPHPRSKYDMTEELWMKEVQRQRENFGLFEEHFKAEYTYEKNQDGQELRYKRYGYGKLE